jgi:hypothetical protein
LLLFRRTMSVSLHRLIRDSMGSFPAAFVAPFRNREYLDTFLHSAEVVTCTHKRSKPWCTSESWARPHFLCMGPSRWSKPITVLLCDLLVPNWWSKTTGPLGTPRGRCDEYSNKIFPQLRNQGLSFLERRDKRLKVMQTGLIALQQGRRLTILVDSSSASSNAEPAHNTTKYFAPNLRWGCQSHRFAWNKGYECIEWKTIEVCE